MQGSDEDDVVTLFFVFDWGTSDYTEGIHTGLSPASLFVQLLHVFMHFHFETGSHCQ